MANPSPESDRQQFSVLNYKSTSQIPKAAKSPDQTKFEALMIVNFLVTFGGCVLSCGGAFMFDAPNSEKNPATVALFWTILALPFTSVGSLLVGGSLKPRAIRSGMESNAYSGNRYRVDICLRYLAHVSISRAIQWQIKKPRMYMRGSGAF